MIEEIKDKIKQIEYKISITKGMEIIDLKREKYNLKLKLLDLITKTEQQRAGITARQLKDRLSKQKKTVIYATGIKDLDDALDGGFEQGSFIQLAGQSFVGKTHLVLDILSNIVEYHKGVLFNFEMGDRRIIGRLNKLLTKEQQWDNLIIDSDSRNIRDLMMEITLYADDGIKFFMIDSKMKIYVDGINEDHKQFSHITKELSRLASQKEVIIMFINQMSEDDIKSGRLALKGSGDQQYDSDITLFYIKDEKSGVRTLVCNKNRTINEKLFRITLKLDNNGKTVGINNYSNEPVVTEFKEDSILVDIPDF